MWSLDILSSLVPIEVIQAILKMPPPNHDKGDDRIAWGLARDGHFSYRSAYESLLGVYIPTSSPTLSLIWSW